MQTVVTIGLDLAKSVFQVHGVNGEGESVIKRALRRSQVLGFLGFQNVWPAPSASGFC